jgi:hypothetical protein
MIVVLETLEPALPIHTNRSEAETIANSGTKTTTSTKTKLNTEPTRLKKNKTEITAMMKKNLQKV